MGTCFSKKSGSTCVSAPPVTPSSNPKQETKSPNPPPPLVKKSEEGTVKKEIFIIKHRKSHEVERRSEEEKGESKKAAAEVLEPVRSGGSNGGVGKEDGIVVSAPVRTSSCTKEEVDAILIQCGRLSRSSSTGKAAFSGSSDNNTGNLQRTKKYSGSKRSYDFDNENGGENPEENGGDGETERVHRHRQRERQPRGSASPSSSHSRRRTPSREREQATQQQRSGSRERGSSNGGRRVSRSPGRRSESPITVASGNGNGRPGKMVSVPATVSSLAMDKSIDAGGEPISAAAVKRIQVKRNVGGGGGDGSRTAASPRARSPARTSAKENQPVTLSRSNSRKAEHSPYRRNPLSEIDTNVVIEPVTKPAKNTTLSQVQKMNGDNISNGKVQGGTGNKQLIMEEAKAVQALGGNVAVNVVVPGSESLKPQGVTRSRSSRLSRDLDLNPEALLNSNSTQNYTALLLEDIQNFHQKNTPNAPAFSLPACVTKACSILEAVADLNSSTSSNLTEDRRRNFTSEQFVKNDNTVNPPGKKRLGVKDPFMESEVAVGDDLMEPSIHKYVTTRRGNVEGGDTEDQESSGSNSFVSGQPHWLSPSSWEPNSSDTTSRSYYSRDDNLSPLGFQRNVVSEPSHEMAAKKRDLKNQQTGIGGHGRVGPRGLHVSPMAATS
ncbi:PREDICTED: uncharacterized protein At1g65710-like [Ipomoea nil]|uniref:uncharacterized protein At1g65710-like n=1 Tax=Ipomoea nil TaxID=35883 RepID=UPI000901EC88|nr:PREDICTED: uncharacterized protein At1g65710-like [Ipomoea nil]